MNEAGANPEIQRTPSVISWEERLEDHNNKIEEYLENCLFRGSNVESTLYDRKTVLKSIFRRVEFDDPTHPTGRRHLLVWDLLNPSLGPYCLGLIISSLLNDDTAPGTRRKYMNYVLYFCNYVLAKPNIAGTSGQSIADKYGPIAATFTKYDLPIHASDRLVRNRYALSPALLEDSYEFLRTEYLPNHSLPHIGARNFTIIILQAEIGARSSEVLGIRSGGESCDVDLIKGRIRLFGKGTAYSGKRVRWVPLTPLAAEVLNTFVKVFKPMFPRSTEGDYLFLREDGSRFTNFAYYKTFRKIVKLARDFGLPLPEDLRPHDLRRTFATNALEANPLAYRKVLKQLGHTNPSSAAPYLICPDEEIEEEQGDLIDIFVDPNIEKKGNTNGD